MVTSTELGYLSGVTSNIQTQLDGKVSVNSLAELGAIEMNSANVIEGCGGYIDFHYNGAADDFTSRIICWNNNLTFYSKSITIGGSMQIITDSFGDNLPSSGNDTGHIFFLKSS